MYLCSMYSPRLHIHRTALFYIELPSGYKSNTHLILYYACKPHLQLWKLSISKHSLINAVMHLGFIDRYLPCLLWEAFNA